MTKRDFLRARLPGITRHRYHVPIWFQWNL